GLVGLPAVVAVRIVVVDAGDRLDVPEVLLGQPAGHDGLDLVVHALEGPLGIGHRFLDALLRRTVPGEPRHLHLLRDRAQRQCHAGGDAADDDLDLVLEDELAVALDRVLGRGLFFHDELYAPAQEAARIVDALGPPFGRAEPSRADGRRDARADG